MSHTRSVVFVLALLSLRGFVSAKEAQRPNMIYIMADDLGIGDVKCYGNDRCKIATPHIDQIARNGMRFTDAHAIASVCVPTRVAIMTGRYPWRFRGSPGGGPWGFLSPRIPKGYPTLGTLLQQYGYYTGYIGKWHLGTLMPTTNGKNQGPTNVDYSKPLRSGPNDYGFHHSFILPGSLDMYPYVFVRNHRFVGKVTAQKGWSAFNRVGPAAEDFEDHKVLDTLSTEAEDFIAQQHKSKSGKPFFLYFALTAPHTPTCPSKPFLGKSGLGLYGDFVQETDHCVGRILQALKRHKLDQRTLVIFTSDHGAAVYAGNTKKATVNNLRQLEKKGHYSNGIYRDYKFSVYEGGLRVPFVAQWPGTIKPGTVCEELIGLGDLVATVADINGQALPDRVAPDSISFLPLLTGKKGKGQRRSLIMQSTHSFVVRQEQWKLALCPGCGGMDVWGNEPKREPSWRSAIKTHGNKPKLKDLSRAPFVQLFDLGKDPTESNNLAAKQPKKVEQLYQLLLKRIKTGRSRPGPEMTNDRPVRIFDRVPGFVLQK